MRPKGGISGHNIKRPSNAIHWAGHIGNLVLSKFAKTDDKDFSPDVVLYFVYWLGCLCFLNQGIKGEMY